MPETMLTRVGRIIGGLSNAALDAVEDRNGEAIARQALREIDDVIHEARLALGKIKAEDHRLSARRGQLSAELDALPAKLTTALASGRDDLARSGIARQIDLESQIEAIDSGLASVAERHDSASKALQAAHAARRDAEHRIALLRLPEDAGADALVDYGDDDARTRRLAQSLRAIDRATGTASTASDAALEDLDRLHRDHAIEQRLLALALPALFPFTLAALVMAGLVLVEAASLAVGHSASGLVDAIFGHDAGHSFGDSDGSHATAGYSVSPAAWLSWVNVGRVPLLILLILGLAGFALVGFVLQTLAGAVLAPLPPWAATAIAAVAMVPALRVASRGIARVMPRDESYAVTADDLVGATAEVILGPLDAGLPGQVRAVDRYGNTHFLRARAAANAPIMQTGERVLLVDRADAVFMAVPATRDL